MALIISPRIREKLAEKHGGVSEREVIECFCSMGKTLLDEREDHKTDPPTQWFIGETYHGRKLKIIFISENGNVILKSAFTPNAEELRIYAKYS